MAGFCSASENTVCIYLANGMYLWYSFGTWLRKRDGTVPVASDFSISCRCVMRVGFFLPAVAVFAFSVSEGVDEGADVAWDGAGEGVVSGAGVAGAGAAAAGAGSGSGDADGAGAAVVSVPEAGALCAIALPAGRLIANAIAITGKHFISNTPVNVLRTGRISKVVRAI